LSVMDKVTFFTGWWVKIIAEPKHPFGKYKQVATGSFPKTKISRSLTHPTYTKNKWLFKV
jgi:hypothetical protein